MKPDSASKRGWLLIGVFTTLALVLGMLFKGSFDLQAVWIWILWCGAILACLAPVIALAIWRGKPDGWNDFNALVNGLA
jgi:hypothetical protein